MELGNLVNLEFLHVHHNQLIGTAPLVKFKEPLLNSFIADCGDPNWLLPDLLDCRSCTICCNSKRMCQANQVIRVPMALTVVMVIVFPPCTVLLLLYFFSILIKQDEEKRDLSGANDFESVYCFVFANNRGAGLIYILTTAVQIWLFFNFLQASDFHNDDSDWQYSMRCPDNDLRCEDESSVSRNGWFLFLVVTSLYLGKDFVNSSLQIKRALMAKNLQLALSGFVLLGLTVLAMFTSIFYNMALAQSNTDLIVNAVILLFINDLDEKTMDLLRSMVPNWTQKRIEEVKDFIEKNNTFFDEIHRAQETMVRVNSGRAALGLETSA